MPDRRVHGGLQIFDVREVDSTLGFWGRSLESEEEQWKKKKAGYANRSDIGAFIIRHAQLREKLTGPERDLLSLLTNVSLMQDRLNVKNFPLSFDTPP